ncbi:MAG TPA: hypothetical protein PKE00_12245, partial [Planctomycetota bacterium]|nr:hypothetical protein [Planctomycetota bacterium]
GWSDRFAFGTVPLPLTLWAPNCQLTISPDVLVPAVHFRRVSVEDEGQTSQVVPTPQLTSLYGSTIFLQYLFLVQNGSPTLATGNGVAATFTTQTPSLGVSLVATTNTTSSSGRVFLDFSPVMQLEAK